jgi:hypothetical protein
MGNQVTGGSRIADACRGSHRSGENLRLSVWAVAERDSPGAYTFGRVWAEDWLSGLYFIQVYEGVSHGDDDDDDDDDGG